MKGQRDFGRMTSLRTGSSKYVLCLHIQENEARVTTTGVVTGVTTSNTTSDTSGVTTGVVTSVTTCVTNHTISLYYPGYL